MKRLAGFFFCLARRADFFDLASLAERLTCAGERCCQEGATMIAPFEFASGLPAGASLARRYGRVSSQNSPALARAPADFRDLLVKTGGRR
jgi:hypothetical protein